MVGMNDRMNCNIGNLYDDNQQYYSHDDPATSDRMVCLRGPINGLLLCTKPERWRRPLQRFLTDYTSMLDDPLKEGLLFISTMISEARSLKYQEPNQLHYVPIGAEFQPPYFHVDRWRHLMSSLGFILEEPDEPYTDLHLCSVFLHEMMPSPMLNGFHVLLRCLTVLSAEQIHAILDMSEEDAECLLFALKATEDKTVNISAFMHTLWDKHSELLTSLGYQHAPHPNYLHQYIHTEYHGGTDYIGRIGPDELGPRAPNQLYPLPQAYAVMLAFHGHAPDVVAETPV